MAEIASDRVRKARLGEITGYQWLVLFVAWAAGRSTLPISRSMGWCSGRPSPNDRRHTTMARSVRWAADHDGRLLGWAVGGFVFGHGGDYIGRVRTLALSILIYSVFTPCRASRRNPGNSACFVSSRAWHRAELMIAIPLVAEAFAETHRAKILGFMMTGGVRDLFAAYLYDLSALWLALRVLLWHRPGDPIGVHPPRHGRAGAVCRIKARRQALAATSKSYRR